MSSFRKTITDSKCLILAGVGHEIGNEDFSGFENTFIYGHECTATTSELKAKNLHLHTWSFTYSPNFAIVIDGKTGGTAAAKNASSLLLSSDRLLPIHPITIRARGTDGEPGSSGIAVGGNGGKGGDGGNGGDVVMIYNNAYRNLFRKSGQVSKDKSADDWKRRLDAWFKSVKSTLNEAVKATQSTSRTAISLPESVTRGLNQLETTLGQPDAKWETLEHAFDSLKEALDASSHEFSANMRVDVGGGAYGAGGDGAKRGENGAPGKPGNSKSMHMTLRNVIDSTEPLVHPDQVALMVTELENLYFIGSPDTITAATRHLLALRERLVFLDQLKPQDSLFKSYADKDKEKELGIISSGGPEPTSISSLKGSLQHVHVMGRRLNSGLDLYGHAANWVPSVSFELYRDLLGTVLDDFVLIKDNYFKYQEIAQSQGKVKERIAHARAAVKEGKEKCERSTQSLQNDLRSLEGTIAVLQNDLPAKRKALVKRIRESAEKIKETTNVSFEGFVDIASGFVSASGISLDALRNAVDLLRGEVETISGVDDVKVQKEYIVNKIYDLSDGLDNLEQKIEADFRGGLSVDDPGAAKLIAKDADVSNLLMKYSNILGKARLENLREMFDDYLKVVMDRNNQVMQYNACLVKLLETKAKLVSYEQTAASLGREFIERIDYEIPQLAATIERNYLDTISTVMELLYLTSKALSYVALSVQPVFFTKLRSHGFLNDGLAAALKQAKIDILNSWVMDIEQSQSMRQPFGGTDRPVQYKLTQDQLQSLLQQPQGSSSSEFSVTIGIPAVYQETSVQESPFANYADVRLTRVRFYIDGARTDDGRLQVVLRHSGSDDIVSPDNKLFKFTRKSLTFKFHYDMGTGGITTDGNVQDLIGNAYALPGPFTSWGISVSRMYNKGLDMSNVKSAWFEFSGISRTFE